MAATSEKENLFTEFDNEIESIHAAIKYAEEHFDEFVAKKKNSAKTVYTTLGCELGIACPDLINHRVIGGHKRGRIIKEKNEADGYCEIGYDENDNPIHFTHINSFGRENAYFFFEYSGYHWTLNLWVDDPFVDKKCEYYGKYAHGDVTKYCYDGQGRISYYAEISRASISANKYEYPENITDPIICRHYYYVPNLSKSSKDIPAGYEHSPMRENLYEISPDMKVIREYYKSEEEFVFNREICSRGKKSAKPKIAEDSFERLAEWLDKELAKDIPTDGGVYFDIFGETEDGFGLSLCITEDFTPDDDDWGCYVVYSSDMLMISTNGEMEWEDVLKNVVRLLKKYLREGNSRSLLKKYKGVGTAYSDSDIEYIYIKK